MPMAASGMAALAYFSTHMNTRSTTGMRVLIWGSMIWGALMMPYYLLYLPVIALTAFLIARVSGEKPEFWKFINLPLHITSVILGTAISAFTWLRGSPEFSRDPWLTIRPLVDSLTAPQLIGIIFLGALIVFTLWQGLIHSTNRATLERQLGCRHSFDSGHDRHVDPVRGPFTSPELLDPSSAVHCLPSDHHGRGCVDAR